MDKFLNRMNLNTNEPPFTYEKVMKINLEEIGTISSKNDLNTIPYHMLHSFMFSKIDRPTIPEIELQHTHFSDGADETVDDYAHPMDVFLYIFMRCDPLFRQIFVNQISKCQLSLPLVIHYTEIGKPIIFSFAYRSLINSYYCTAKDQYQSTVKDQYQSTAKDKYQSIAKDQYQSTAKKEMVDFHVSDEQLNVVSFIRIGSRANIDKSKLLNDLLQFRHQCFFDEDSEGCTADRLLLDGTIEMNWYLPDEEDGESALHSKPLIMLNLRGNALEFPEQVKFLFKISSMVGIMIKHNELESNEFEILRTFIDDRCENICLIIEGTNVNSIKAKFGQLSNNIRIHVGKKFLQMNKLIRKTIQEFVKNNSLKCQSILNFSQQAKTNTDFILEEDLQFEEYVKSLEKFKQKILMKASNISFLEDSLSLQVGWEKFAEEDKNYLKSGFLATFTDFNTTNYRDLQRLTLFNNLNQSTIGNISELMSKTYKDASYKLTLLKIELEKLSLNNRVKTKFMKTKQSCLEIRHFLRELGQFYEIQINGFNSPLIESINAHTKINYKDIPGLIVHLLLLGHPFEIMDGDAQHIPFLLVKAVLNELEIKLGKVKKIFVLGVLGIQSSGKSTLLNTMFGLQFPVASGRCTRGASMQVISMQENQAMNLQYDYMVVVDCEGLRSINLPDEVRIARDNVLATFVVGICDLTLVNIMGENSADWEDIFQIIIMALIKLKLCDSRVKCFFIHQNVQQNAKTNLKESYKQFISRLDSVTSLVSSEVKYTKLTDIIDFDIDHSIFLFNSLFTYPLPRSQISSHYKNSACTLLNHIVRSHYDNMNEHQFCTMLEWSEKIKTVWTSIQKEDFVFSYKNMREHNCYMELEGELHQWSCMFTCEMERTWLLIRDRVLTMEYKEAWNNISLKIIKECKNVLNDKEKRIMEDYFVNHKYKEIFSQWKTMAKSHFGSARLRHEFDMNCKLKDILQFAEANEHIFAEFNKKRNTILERAKEAQQKIFQEVVKNKTSQDFDAESYFEEEWEKLAEGIEADPSPLEELFSAINEETKNGSDAEKEKIQSHCKLLRENKEKYYKFISCSNHYSISQEGKRIDAKEIHINENNQNIQTVDKLREKICDLYNIYSESIRNMEYTPVMYTEIISLISIHVKIFNSSDEKSSDNKIIQIENMFTYELSLSLCTDIMNKFIEMNKTNKIDKLKIEIRQNFINSYSPSMAFANGLANILYEKMNNYIADIIPILLSQQFSDSGEYRISSKCQLQADVLIALVKINSFNKYTEYIKNSNKIMKKWIEKKFRKFFKLNSQKFLESVNEGRKLCVDNFIEAFKRALVPVEELGTKSKDKINPNWKTKLHQLVEGSTRQFKQSDLDVILVEPNMITDSNEVVQLLTESLNHKADSENIDNLLKVEDVIVKLSCQLLYKNIFYCNEFCPLCKEPCLSSDNSPTHKHTCGSFHRPLCVNGWFNSGTNKFYGYDCSTIPKDKSKISHQVSKYSDCAEALEKWDDCVKHYMTKSVYWEWIMHKFSDEFIKYYGYQTNEKALSVWSKWNESLVLDQLQQQINDFHRPRTLSLYENVSDLFKYYFSFDNYY